MSYSRTVTGGRRRTVPPQPTPEQHARLRALVDDPATWVLRHAWDGYLRDGAGGCVVDPQDLSSDHQIAALAWLRQQRHPLYRALEGGPRAPDGWLESLPLHRRLIELVGHPAWVTETDRT